MSTDSIQDSPRWQGGTRMDEGCARILDGADVGVWAGEDVGVL